MVILGITGMIAAGKSTVSQIIKNKYDAVVFDADEIAKEVIKELKLNNENIINNPTKIYKVEQDMMPHFIKRLESFIDNNKDKKFIVLDIPLLYEFNLQKYCDKTVNIYCAFDTRVKRIQNRPNMDINKFMFLNNKQMNDEERNSRADYVINTDVSEDEVSNKIDEIISLIENN